MPGNAGICEIGPALLPEGVTNTHLIDVSESSRLKWFNNELLPVLAILQRLGGNWRWTVTETQTQEKMEMCPMASMCKGMMEKRRSRLVLLLPGLVFILLGIVVLIEPRVLVWLIAAVVIVLGVLFLMMGNFLHRMGH
jgi:hypothetical protein